MVLQMMSLKIILSMIMMMTMCRKDAEHVVGFIHIARIVVHYLMIEMRFSVLYKYNGPGTPSL